LPMMTSWMLASRSIGLRRPRKGAGGRWANGRRRLCLWPGCVAFSRLYLSVQSQAPRVYLPRDNTLCDFQKPISRPKNTSLIGSPFHSSAGLSRGQLSPRQATIHCLARLPELVASHKKSPEPVSLGGFEFLGLGPV
jgi:hypothetical protein